MRFFSLLLFLVASSLGAETLEICFIGNAAIQISDGKTTLLSDFPYQSGAFGYMEYSWENVQPKGQVVVLITHQHADHFDAPLLAKTNWRVVGPPDVAAKIPPIRLIPIAGYVEFQGIRIDPIVTPHARVNHYSYLVTWHGKRFYFTGDTESTEELLAQQNLDTVFVTPWLVESVLSSNRTINARSWIIYHHTTSQKLPAGCDRCKLPVQGECFSL